MFPNFSRRLCLFVKREKLFAYEMIYTSVSQSKQGRRRLILQRRLQQTQCVSLDFWRAKNSERTNKNLSHVQFLLEMTEKWSEASCFAMKTHIIACLCDVSSGRQVNSSRAALFFLLRSARRCSLPD